MMNERRDHGGHHRPHHYPARPGQPGAWHAQIIPIEDEAINTAVSTIWTVIAALAAWWKNNSFTSAALMGDRVKNEVKAAG